MNTRILSIVVLGLSLLNSRAAITITDHSFESLTAAVTSPGLIVLSTNAGTLGGWSVTASGIGGLTPAVSSVSCGLSSLLGGAEPDDGNYVARLSLPIGLGVGVGMRQVLPDLFLPNTHYTLSVDLDQGTVPGLISGTHLDLLAGAVPVASLTALNLLGALDANSGFQRVSLEFQTGESIPAGNIGISLSSSSLIGLGGNIYADNFALSATAVPEPSPVILGLMFLVVTGIWRLRIKQTYM